jgi:UDP-glucuronate decarboxylase
MKVLVAGGYGFIGSFVADRLYKEGHDVFILDNLSSGISGSIQFRHKFFQLNVENEECETVFRSNSFDAVVYAVSNANISSSISKPIKDSITSVIGVENFLHLCGKYNVPKFVFLSSAAVYGESEENQLKETGTCKPISPYGYHKLLGEELCKKWSDTYQFSTVILRLSNVFGPRDHHSIERGVISVFIERMLQQKDLHVFGDGNHTRDFIFVDDVADAIYRVITSEITGTYNLSSNNAESINELIEQFSEIHQSPTSIYKGERNGDIVYSVLDNQRLARDLDWVPRYSLKEGLEKTFKWNYNQINRKSRHSLTRILDWRKNLYQTYKTAMPFIENIFQFIIFAVLDYGTFQSNHLIDYKLVYVLMIGMFLGKTQAILACFLTVVLYIYENIAYGREFISLFLDNNTLSHIAMYLFFGLVIGYIIDKKNIAVKTLKEEYIVLQEKYDFLDEVFKETRKIKDELQNQITYTEDSIGKIFELASKLDSLEPEDIFNGSISVIEQTMKTKAVSIYLVSKDLGYLRLVSKSHRLDVHFPNSIKITQGNEYSKVITEKKMVFNHQLDMNLPILMAPIIKNNEVIGIVCLNEVNFDRLTLYYQNLFEVVIKLISSSISRAYEFVTVTQPNRFIKDTNILWPEYFSKILTSKIKAKDQLNIPFYILEVIEIGKLQLTDVMEKTRKSIRETDSMGLDTEGRLWILLSNTTEKEANIVSERLINKGLSIRFAQEEEVYV